VSKHCGDSAQVALVHTPDTVLTPNQQCQSTKHHINITMVMIMITTFPTTKLITH